MFQPIQTLPFPGFALSKLLEIGFLYCEDLWCNEASTRDANELLRPWGSDACEQMKLQASSVVTRSALDIWQEECSLGSVVTFCKELDDALGGGVPLQSVTELCGAPGSGKTQMCLQLCVDVQIPRCCGGVEGTAMYIDTKSGFTPSRLADMATAWAEHCRAAYSREVTVDELLRGVSYVATHDVTQLMAALHLAHRRLRDDPQVKLLVVDSLTFPFQYSAANSLGKTRLLSVAMDKLHAMASAHKIAWACWRRVERSPQARRGGWPCSGGGDEPAEHARGAGQRQPAGTRAGGELRAPRQPAPPAGTTSRGPARRRAAQGRRGAARLRRLPDTSGRHKRLHATRLRAKYFF
ncbi:DNA repair protein RAD51 homolog 3-like isoform X1 [Bacillus rossius redtenbacheri]|uniref:DNA repair protein RAD51 homolog 3-like isoform X1 n=1 Tax=Bacillus rossius redtenbacheri TaxID=93214 RepID=UPI002FDEC190